MNDLGLEKLIEAKQLLIKAVAEAQALGLDDAARKMLEALELMSAMLGGR